MTNTTAFVSALYPNGVRFPSPSSAFVPVGTITLNKEMTFSYLSQYPGADVYTLCQPQTVSLESNGYYVKAIFEGIVTGRGYYGGDVNVSGTHTFSPYVYLIEDLVSGGTLNGGSNGWDGKFSVTLND